MNAHDLIAENITKKGVSAANTDTFRQLAAKILEIDTSSGSGEVTTINLLDCSSFTSSTAVYNAYKDKVKVSNDGAYATYTALGDHEYNKISANYEMNTAGISIKTESVNSTGFYFTDAFTTTSSDILLKSSYYVSTWINPAIKVCFIDSTADAETAADFALVKDITLANAMNNTPLYTEIIGLVPGTYRLMVQIPTATGGNQAIIEKIALICL